MLIVYLTPGMPSMIIVYLTPGMIHVTNQQAGIYGIVYACTLLCEWTRWGRWLLQTPTSLSSDKASTLVPALFTAELQRVSGICMSGVVHAVTFFLQGQSQYSYIRHVRTVI